MTGGGSGVADLRLLTFPKRFSEKNDEYIIAVHTVSTAVLVFRNA